MTMEIIKVKKLHEDAVIPTKSYAGDSGFDLYALEDVIIEPTETMKIQTGLAFEMPLGYEIQIRGRSGVSTNTKLRVVLGTVDSDYRGEVAVIIDNIAQENEYNNAYAYAIDGKTVVNLNSYGYPSGTYIIRRGDRIAQAVVQKIPHISMVEAKELGKGLRGTNGFGSTGINHEH